MASEGTHIRIAIDLKDKFRVHDLKRYIIGAVYPDSRFVTGIDRLLTHPVDFLNWHWEDADDFKKGWLVHLLTDRVQLEVIKEKLPQVFAGEIVHGSEVWIKHTAIKILQDIEDVRSFDILPYLHFLESGENPNGEDYGKIKEYHQILIRAYSRPDQVNIHSGYEILKDLGFGEDYATKIKIQAECYAKDHAICSMVKEIYPEMLKRLLNTK